MFSFVSVRQSVLPWGDPHVVDYLLKFVHLRTSHPSPYHMGTPPALLHPTTSETPPPPPPGTYWQAGSLLDFD